MRGAGAPVRETIFSSEICSVEYEDREAREARPGQCDTQGPGDSGGRPGTILFDDIGKCL